MLSIKMGIPQVIMTVVILAEAFRLADKDKTLEQYAATAIATIIYIAVLKWGGFY